jgi:hypothetical protein
MQSLNNILELLKKKKILIRKALKSIDLDEILESREDPGFDKNWISRFEQIESKYKSKNDSLAESIVEQIREKSFKLVFSATEDDDLAAYVSDDFELICMHICEAKHDAWIAGMLEMYTRSPKLNFRFKISEKSYEDILNTPQQSG